MDSDTNDDLCTRISFSPNGGKSIYSVGLMGFTILMLLVAHVIFCLIFEVSWLLGLATNYIQEHSLDVSGEPLMVWPWDVMSWSSSLRSISPNKIPIFRSGAAALLTFFGMLLLFFSPHGRRMALRTLGARKQVES
ncbi:hypothetical protein RYA05_04455 [Pseudomonas syringae pv. actinidiae]|nr:hypothetical protein [Pseudomonas syringae pv. actinidiae]